MSDHPHGTLERSRTPESPAPRVVPAPVASAIPQLIDLATISRLVARPGEGAHSTLKRFPDAQRHQALLSLQPVFGNAGVQRVLRPKPQRNAVGAPHIQRDSKGDRKKAALEAAKADAVAAGASVAALEKLLARDSAEVSLGTTRGGREVKAFYFKGAISEVALVIAGVHGSELSGVEIAENLIRLLSSPNAPRPFYTVVIVPQLFPDNVDAKRAWEKSVVKAGQQLKLKEYQKARSAAKDPGRYSSGTAERVDPNRQFPELGKPFDPNNPVDARGRPIERENIMLLTLIDRFKPTRIASLHAIKDPKDAGIFADPHPSTTGASGPQHDLGQQADQLAKLMAEKAGKLGAQVPGNTREGSFTSLYPGQDPKLSAEQIERENKAGRSLGQWGPSQGALVLTIEVNEQYASDSPVEHPSRKQELEAHAAALQEIFLGPSLAAFAVEFVIDPIMERLRNAREDFIDFVGGSKGGGVRRQTDGSPGRLLGVGPANQGGTIARQPTPASPAPAPPAPVKRYSLNSGVTLTADAEKVVGEIADAYYAITKKELVVTSGTRTAASQAGAMYDKLELGDDVVKLYGGSSAVKDIKKAYDAGKKAKKSRSDIVDDMTKVIENQIKAGRYISKHLRAGAVDIRSRDMSDAEKKAFRKAAKGKVKSILLETKPPHWHLQL